MKDLYVYVCDDELIPDFDDYKQLVWVQKNLVYGDWTSGPNGDGIYTKEATVPLSKVSHISCLCNKRYIYHSFKPIESPKQWHSLDAYLCCEERSDTLSV